MSTRETVIDLGSSVKIYKMYNVSDDVNKEGVQFNKKREPVGGEFICEFFNCGGFWNHVQNHYEFNGVLNGEPELGSILWDSSKLTITFDNLTQDIIKKLIRVFPEIHESQSYSLLIVLEKNIYNNIPYGIIYQPVIIPTHNYTYSSGKTVYSIAIQALIDHNRKMGDQLGCFFIPDIIKEAIKCPYCESKNTRQLDEKYIKDVHAEYCCEDCGEYFSIEKEENKFDRISKSNFRDAVNYIPEVKTYKEAMSILWMSSLFLESLEIKEIEKNIKERWITIYHERVKESLRYIRENYRYSEYQEGTRELYEERLEKMWNMFIKNMMNITCNTDIQDIQFKLK